MARDRQRAKQRRRRQSADGETAGRPVPREEAPSAEADRVDSEASATPDPDGLDAARDTGIEDVLDERGAPGSTPAPDPLKHGSPYVDEAKLAEAGAELDSPEDQGARRAPDEVEYPAGSASGSGRRERPEAGTAERPRGRALSFLRHSAEELKRVQWPNRRQTGQGTAVVLGFVVLAGGYLGLVDAIWQPIIEAII